MLTKDLFKTLYAYHWNTTLLLIESAVELNNTDHQEESCTDMAQSWTCCFTC